MYYEEFKDKTQLDLVSQKGIYPYEYIDSSKRFEEAELPPIERWYSTLSDSTITEKELKHAKRVWKTCNIRTLGEYHDLYLKTDVLLLTDVFENFRSTCLEFYKLDPAHYFTSPGLKLGCNVKNDWSKSSING